MTKKEIRKKVNKLRKENADLDLLELLLVVKEMIKSESEDGKYSTEEEL